MEIQKLIDIQQYWGGFNYTCKPCGQELKTESLVFIQQGSKVRMICPDCEGFLGWAKQSKVVRIWKNIKEGMVEIEKIDRGWLKWALSINHTSLRKPIEIEAARRRIASVDENPIPDYRLTEEDKKRIELLSRVDYLAEEIGKLTKDRARLMWGSEELSYSETQLLLTKSAEMGKDIEKLARERRRGLDWLRDNPA